MNVSDDGGAGGKPTPAPDKKKGATEQDMTQSTLAGDQPTPTDAWWDGQLKALYQSVLDEPLPEDMMKLIRAPKHKNKRGDVKARGSRKPEDE